MIVVLQFYFLISVDHFLLKAILLLSTIFMGACSYFAALWVLKSEDFKLLISNIRKN